MTISHKISAFTVQHRANIMQVIDLCRHKPVNQNGWMDQTGFLVQVSFNKSYTVFASHFCLSQTVEAAPGKEPG